MTTRLFDNNKVTKFFNILKRLSGSIPIDKTNYPWKNYQTIYTKDSNHCPCTREVFVHRTVNKWLKNKFLILYKESDIGILYKQYILLSYMNYQNDWGTGYINVSYIDFSKFYDSTLSMSIKHKDALYLEGEWCIDGKPHSQLIDYFTINNVPNKEYIFKTFKVCKKKIIESTQSFIARTENEAYKLKDKFMKDNPKIFAVGELIEVKEII